MNPRLSTLLAPALAAASLLAVAGPANAAAGKPHDATSPLSSPGRQPVALSLPAAAYNVKTDTQLKAALKAALPGQVIHLANGASFSGIYDATARAGWVTISGAGDSVVPSIAGANLFGSQYLRFTNVRFTDRVTIARSTTRGSQQPAENIQILNSEITCLSTPAASKGTGIQIRQASQNVTLEGDLVDYCTLGLTTVAQDNPTQNLTIVHNTFQNFYGDAIDIGGNNNTTISDNVVQNIHHVPGIKIHDDGIQFLGNTNNTTIQGNVLANSADQLIFIQDALKGTYSGVQTNSNILVDHNLLYGAGAVAMQDQGGLDTRITNNTIWNAKDGSLLLRKSPYTGTLPTDTVVANNILQTYTEGAVRPALESHNIITAPTPHKAYGATDLLSVAPTFVNAALGDFALVSGTAGSGSAATTLPASGATTLSAFSTMSLGAEPADFDYGAPIYGIPKVGS